MLIPRCIDMMTKRKFVAVIDINYLKSNLER